MCVYLRTMTYDDTDLIVQWRNSDSVRKNFIYQALFTRESHENWIRTKVETGDVVQMIICETGTDKPVGSVYVRDIDHTHEWSAWEYLNKNFSNQPLIQGEKLL